MTQTAFLSQKLLQSEKRLGIFLESETSYDLNRRSENVVIHPVIITKLKFSDVEWQILPADFMERADDATLEDAPEAFNRLGVNGTDNVLALRSTVACG